MDKRNFISVTLLVTALAFNPLYAEHHVKTSSQIKQNRVSSNIASILHKRGLDEDAAKEISENFVNEEEDELFALLIDNLINGCNEVNKNEVLEYLSTAALHRQNVDLDSYAQLVSMVSRIKEKLLDEKTLKELSAIAKSNAYYAQSYRADREKLS